MVVPMTMTIKRAAEKHKSVPFEIEIRKRGHEERWRVLLYSQTRRHVRARKERLTAIMKRLWLKFHFFALKKSLKHPIFIHFG